MRISDWSSDVCSSDLPALLVLGAFARREIALDRPEIERRLVDMQFPVEPAVGDEGREELVHIGEEVHPHLVRLEGSRDMIDPDANEARVRFAADIEIVLGHRSEEHTSELQSLMRISYAVFCLKKNKYQII